MGVRPGEGGGLVGSKVGGRVWCGVNAKKGGPVGVFQGGCVRRIEDFLCK